jgi:hypothetical protein
VPTCVPNIWQNPKSRSIKYKTTTYAGF